MSPLDAIVIARADEQAQAVRFDHGWERDSWAVKGPQPKPARKKSRARCLAGDCDGRVVAMGYCQMHAHRIRRGHPVDGVAILTNEDLRRMSSGLRFGYSPAARASTGEG
jgi:hypothetical protein